VKKHLVHLQKNRSSMRKLYSILILAFLASISVHAQVVINEAYGGGGNSGAAFNNDFVELYNNGNSTVVMTDWSIQYTSSAGTSWGNNKTVFSGTIASKGYFLVKLAAGATANVLLPTEDALGTTNMSGSGGKLILANSNVSASSVANPVDAQIIDKLSYGASATVMETANAPATTNSSSVQRMPTGTDTDNNSADFGVGTPTPMNSGGFSPDITAPTITFLSPVTNTTDLSSSRRFSIQFSEPVLKNTGNIVIYKKADNSVFTSIPIQEALTASNYLHFSLQALPFGTEYYILVDNAIVKDAAGNAFTGISGTTTWTFSTAATSATGLVNVPYTFDGCFTNLVDGFTNFSVAGAQHYWNCSVFGRQTGSSGSLPTAVQVFGFTSSTNVINEDWLISPVFDLSNTTFPLLSFWSTTSYNGEPLQLKVSTNYSGTGDPRNATWTNLQGNFPAAASNAWKESANIDLSAFKQANVYFAFVYVSSDEEGSAWTVDDVLLKNSLNAPPPQLFGSSPDIDLGFAAVGGNVSKSFSLLGTNLTDAVTLSASTGFLLSSDNITFSNSITLTQAAANNVNTTIYVRFIPAAAAQNFTGTVQITTPGATALQVSLSGTSISPDNTLDIVNWNIEWFGSTANGPSDNALQKNNVKAIFQNTGADLYALTEIVSEPLLAQLVSEMPGYAYVISNYSSHTNTSEVGAGPLGEAQKLAFIYKSNMFNNISAVPLLSQGINSAADLTNPAYEYFSSGRFPYMLTADVSLNSIVKKMRFVLLHGKANTSPEFTSYNRRKSGADTLYSTLQSLYPNDNIILLGDLNDDLDFTIADGVTPNATSYISFTGNPSHFFSPTLSLSEAGKKSTTSYDNVLDHVIISNEVKANFLQGSASILTDMAALVPNYESTTSDHYPVLSRYFFDASVVPVSLLDFTATKKNTEALLQWTTVTELGNKEFCIEKSTDGRIFTQIGTVVGAGNSNTTMQYSFVDVSPNVGVNYYRLKQVDWDGTVAYSKIRTVIFNSISSIKIAPNPARRELSIIATGFANGSKIKIELLNSVGQQVLQMNSVSLQSGSYKINVSTLARGLYYVQVSDGIALQMEKVVIE